MPIDSGNHTVYRDQIANIQLQGEPYVQKVTNGDRVEIVDCNESLDELAYNTGYVDKLPTLLDHAGEHLDVLVSQGGYHGLDKRLKHGEDLSFSAAFSLIAFVAASLNRPLSDALRERVPNIGSAETHRLQAVALLASMSTKEAFATLTAAEIAGMVSAAVHLDTVVRTHHPDNTIAFGGMGGDQGYPTEHGNSKLFSLSTLAAIALSVDVAVHKHHSYPNTSKVAGQSAIEAWGARSDFHSDEAFEGVFSETGLLMSSCHNTRTLHTLSHLLKGETINHAIGPLAFTLARETRLHGFVGVNEKIHPAAILEAMHMMHKMGYQDYDGSAVYCGTDLETIHPDMFSPDAYYASDDLRQHVRIDEIAPPPYSSMVAFSVNGQSAGTYGISPLDFYPAGDLAKINFADLLIPNTAEAILHNNAAALSGKDKAKARYLAMTIGLGIFVRRYLYLPDALNPHQHTVNRGYLRDSTAEAYDLLRSGAAMEQLGRYVDVTNKYAGFRGLQ